MTDNVSEANQPTPPSATLPLSDSDHRFRTVAQLQNLYLLARQIRPEVEYVEITHRFGNTALYPVRYYAHMPNECCLGSSVPELLEDLTNSLSKEEVMIALKEVTP